MSDYRSKQTVSTQKTSSSNSSRHQTPPTYAETANSSLPRSNRPSSTATAATKNNQTPRSSVNGSGNGNGNGGGAPNPNQTTVAHYGRGGGRGGRSRSRSRDTQVRLPSRASVSTGTVPPAVQFGSINKQTRSPSPAPAGKAGSTTGPSATPAATSGGVPPSLGRSASKPTFGSIQGNDANASQQNAPASSDPSASARPAHQQQGRQYQHHNYHHYHSQQNQQQHRPGSRSSSQGRQSQGYSSAGGRRDSSSGASNYKPQSHGSKGGHYNKQQQQQQQSQPQPQEQQPQQTAGGDAPFYPPHGYYDPNAYYSNAQAASMPVPNSTAGGAPPYRGHPPHVRPPHNQGPNNSNSNNNPYKAHQVAGGGQGGHYPPPHHMTGQPMSQSMGYSMPVPGQAPMQGSIMTTQPGMQPAMGWMPPPHQFGYMPMGTPGYDQYYRGPQGAAGGPPPQSMYGMPNYSMPNPAHAVSTPPMGGPGGIIPPGGPMSHSPQASGMTAIPAGNTPPQSSHQPLKASAAAFVPGGRRAIKIINPHTNKEVEVKQPRIRSESVASSTPGNETSGTATPAGAAVIATAPITTADTSSTPAESKAEGEEAAGAKPNFKIPTSRSIQIVNPNATPVADKTEVTIEPANVEPEHQPKETVAPVEAKEPVVTTEPPVEETRQEQKQEEEEEEEEEKASTAEPMDIVTEDEEPKDEVKEEPTPAAAAAATTTTTAKAVDALTDSLATTTIAEKSEGKSSVTITTKKDTAVGQSTKEEEKAADVAAEEEEEGEIKDNEKEAEEEAAPTTPQKPSADKETSAVTEGEIHTLAPAEVVELYTGKSNAPVVVNEILRYPLVFLERFNGLCKPPAGFKLEISYTDDRRSSDRASGSRRSGMGRSHDSAGGRSGGLGGSSFSRTNSGHHGSLHSPTDDRYRNRGGDMRNRLEGGRGSMMGRTPSGQYRGPGGGRESRGGRTPSSRGRGPRGGGRGGRGGGSHHGGSSHNELPVNVKPLEKSENRYIAKKFRADKNETENDMDEEVYDRRMRALLNKLTPDNFGSVSTDLLDWGNKSKNETDGRILRYLVMLVYQKAIDEPDWASMYAKLCYRMVYAISPKVVDKNIIYKDGNPLNGGSLVRKYLLTRCQDDFERGWKVEIPKDIESKEYYEAIKIKRQGLGLVRLICELFLLDLLSDRIMHQCVKRLLSNYENPEEEDMESLAKLLITAGKKLDVPDASEYMKAYFARIEAVAVNRSLTSRIRFMLKDVLELRKNGWVVRASMANNGPKTIAEIHDEADRKKAAEAAMRRQASHGGRRNESHGGRRGGGGSGWNTVGGPSGSGRNESNNRIDTSRFGDMTRANNSGLGTAGSPGRASNPFGKLSSGSRGWSSNSDGRNRNRGDDRKPHSLALGGGRTPSHSSRGDSAATSTPEPVGTRNMFEMLCNEESEPAASSQHPRNGGGSSETKPQTMDSSTMQRKIKGMIDEYLQLNMDSELIECFKELNEINYQSAVRELANNVMDRRPDQIDQIAKGVSGLCDADVLSVDTAVAGLVEYSEQLEDIALDAPNAFKFFGMIMAAAHIPPSRFADTLGEVALKVSSPRPPALPVVYAYLKQLVKMDGEDKARNALAEDKFDVSKFFNKDKRSAEDVKSGLGFQDLLPLFPEYA